MKHYIKLDPEEQEIEDALPEADESLPMTANLAEEILFAKEAACNSLLSNAFIKRMKEVDALASAHGIFTHHRALAICLDCQLFEDITFLGKLYVYKGKNFEEDTGLEFKELEENALCCPECGILFCPYEVSLIDFD